MRTIAAALVVALEVERAREPAEQPDAQLRVLVAERGRRLLEQLDRALVGDPGAPAGVLVADRGPREQLGVAELARDLRRRRERLERVERLARAVAGDRRARGRPRARSAGSSIRSSSAVRSRAAASSKASAAVAARAAREVVLDPALGSAERRGGGEVVREVGERAARTPLGALERLADAQVELGPPQRR